MTGPEDRPPAETTLEPADWEAFRRTAHRMLDGCIDLVQGARDGPVWRGVPDAVKEALATPLPMEGEPLEQVCGELERLILPYPTGNIHPRFFGWVHGSGTASGIIADMCMAAMNSNCGGRDHGAVYVERQVIEWCRRIFGLPETASGVLVTGTSEATVIAMAAARIRALGPEVRTRGMHGQKRLTLYCSAESHSATAKAADLLGVGTDGVRRIPIDDQHAILLPALREAIAADREAGFLPFCIVGAAGTVNTGAFDDLDALADICEAEGLWLHVDGAFGAWAGLASDPWRSLTRGLDRADSIAFDFHKWMYVQYDCGGVLIRDEAAHRAAFSARPDYLAAGMALAGGDPWFAEYGIALSRGFRALKVWFALRQFGLERLGEQIAKNCRQAARMADLVRADERLQLLAPVPLNICCFRYAPSGLAEERLDALNRAIVAELQREGVVAFSTTRIAGTLAIRAAITNQRTLTSDIDLAVEAVLDAGARMIDEGKQELRSDS